MTHLEDELIQCLLHGELRVPGEAPVRAHLSGCEDCRRAVRDAEEENHRVRALLGQLDHQPPFLPLTAILARARRRPVAWVRLAATATA